MNTLLRKMRVAVVIATVSMFLGCADQAKENVAAAPESPYSVDYTVFTSGSVVKDSVINITVKGPADKLSMVVVAPDKVACAEIIEKDELVSDQAVTLPPYNLLCSGTYVLMLKNIDSGKIVWQKEFIYPLTKDEQNIKQSYALFAPLLPKQRWREGFCWEAVSL